MTIELTEPEVELVLDMIEDCKQGRWRYSRFWRYNDNRRWRRMVLLTKKLTGKKERL